MEIHRALELNDWWIFCRYTNCFWYEAVGVWAGKVISKLIFLVVWALYRESHVVRIPRASSTIQLPRGWLVALASTPMCHTNGLQSSIRVGHWSVFSVLGISLSGTINYFKRMLASHYSLGEGNGTLRWVVFCSMLMTRAETQIYLWVSANGNCRHARIRVPVQLSVLGCLHWH